MRATQAFNGLIRISVNSIRLVSVLTILNNLEKLDIQKPLSAYPTKRSNTLKQFVGNLPMNCLSMFDHFLRLALKG